MAQRESCGSQQGDKLTVRSTHCIEQKEVEWPRLQHVGIVEVPRLGNARHAHLRVHIPHHRLPGILNIARRPPQVGDVGDPIAAAAAALRVTAV